MKKPRLITKPRLFIEDLEHAPQLAKLGEATTLVIGEESGNGDVTTQALGEECFKGGS
ncbi:MAG: hypothetical protein HYV27_24150 [Candidatus Hydrogenedentes bacterium]|nr:hypothetical protein [Candidatus Hydrogenedentota bacterium]